MCFPSRSSLGSMSFFADAESLLRCCTRPCVLRCGHQSTTSTGAALVRLSRTAVARGLTAAAPNEDAAVLVPLLAFVGVAIDVAALYGAGGDVRRWGRQPVGAVAADLGLATAAARDRDRGRDHLPGPACLPSTAERRRGRVGAGASCARLHGV